MSASSPIIHRGFEAFSRGRFDNGGDNLFVNARGLMSMIHSTDVNGDGHVDIVLPNSHADSERGPTRIYTRSDDGAWRTRELPNDSGWSSRVIDVDGDGFPDLVIANAENGVTSELTSYVYWGGPGGLTGERTELKTVGAYEVTAASIGGSDLPHLVFTSAWVDLHNPGRPRPLHIFEQTSPRRFVDRGAELGVIGVAARSVVAADLNRDGRTDLVVANYRREFEYDIESYVYWGTGSGFDPTPLRLPSHYALHAAVGDLNGDGWSEVVFAGGSQVWIYWNREGRLHPEDRTVMDVTGGVSEEESRIGPVFVHIADVDGDGRNELVVAAAEGVEIRSQDDLSSIRGFLPLTSCMWVDTVDLDGDGRPELVASRFQDGKSFGCESAVFWNGPEGYAMERADWLPTTGAMGCSAGDLDGDGRPEVIVNNTRTGWSRWDPKFPLYVYLGNERNEYRADRRLELPTGHSNTYLVADLDQDGYADLACTSSNGLRIFKGGPEGLHPERFVDLPHRGRGFHYVLAADLDRDGWLDLVGIAFSYDWDAESLAKSSVIYYGSPEGYSVENSRPLPTSARGNGMLADVNKDGWLDIICPDRRGYLAIFLGGPDGYSPDRMWKVPLAGIDVGWVPAVSCADLNEDGWLDIILSYMGHYTRTQPGFILLYGGPDGYSPDRIEFHPTEASSILISAADLNNDGHLDLLVPAYSTQFTRELPAHVYWGDGKSFDFEHPLAIPCDACCAFMAVDITGNGYKDLLAVCHRNDIGHQVDSLLFWNGPGGLDFEHPVRIPGLGPHLSCARDIGNGYTREPVEHYESEPIELGGGRPVRLSWIGETPHRTELRFELRSARSRESLEKQPWSGPEGPGSFYRASGSPIAGVDRDARWLQYRAGFVSPNGCGSPRLTEVRIDTAR